MSNEENQTPENEQQESLLDKVTHAVDSAVETASATVENVAGRFTGDTTSEKDSATTSQNEANGSTSSGRNERKTRDGYVVSNKMDKTISVVIERRLQHPIYGKYVKKSKKLIAHDEQNQCQIGDLVRIMECRPLSRRKRWRLISVLEQAK